MSKLPAPLHASKRKSLRSSAARLWALTRQHHLLLRQGHMLKQAGLDIDYRVVIGEDLPFADESFDIVYCSDVLEHVNDLGKVISEISHVLKSHESSFTTRLTVRSQATW
jgi:2-polyprenyl-3-methyl-5-hydroxy-6-metoxy-1,4-benzoquinol methylase